MIIRTMRDEDLPQVAELVCSLVPYWEVSEDFVQQRYEEIKASGNQVVYVAEKDGEVLGTVTAILCYAMGGNFLAVEDLVVKDSCQRMGVGRALMEQVDRLALEKGCTYTMLCSSGFREGAHRFYESMGYNDSVRGFRKLYI